MNIGMTVDYLGELRCEGTHVKSDEKVLTEAPPDNQGRGMSFSPTDLLCTSLASCMITIMGIAANERGLQLGKIHADIEKTMASDPRRVIGIRIKLEIDGSGLDEHNRTILERAALACPVAKSLNPEIEQNIEFHYT